MVITFASHAKGRRFEPGWNYFVSHLQLIFFTFLQSIWKSCIVGESNPGLPRGRREFYHWTNNACEWEESLDGCSVRKHSRWYSYKQNLFSQYFPATCIHLKPGNDYLEYDQEKSICFFCMKGSHFQLPLVCQQFCSVVVITFASHAKGPRFEPGQN